MRLSTSSLFLACLAACHSAPSQPVPVGGDVLALAGAWEGSYEATDGRRQGVIDFRLRAGSDTAYGDVMMVPQGQDQAVTPDDRSTQAVREGAVSRLLSIRFVQIAGGELSGELDPYRDPDCGCVVHTVFRGRLVADTLKGRYGSRDQDGTPTRDGRWRVVRKPSAP